LPKVPDPPCAVSRWGAARHREGDDGNNRVSFGFLVGIAVGYLWRGYISQARARVRHELREEKRLNALASSAELPAFLSRPRDS